MSFLILFRHEEEGLVGVAESAQEAKGVHFRAVGMVGIDLLHAVGGILFPQHPHHDVLRVGDRRFGGIEIEGADAGGIRLRADLGAEGLFVEDPLQGSLHAGDHPVGRDEFEANDLVRLVDLPFEITAVGRAAHAFIDDLLLLGDPALMENAELVFMDGIDEAAAADGIQAAAKPGRNIRGDRFRIEELIGLRVVNGGAVDGNDGRP